MDTEFTHSLDIHSTPAVCLVLLVIKIARMKDAVEWMIQFPNSRLGDKNKLGTKSDGEKRILNQGKVSLL